MKTPPRSAPSPVPLLLALVLGAAACGSHHGAPREAAPPDANPATLAGAPCAPSASNPRCIAATCTSGFLAPTCSSDADCDAAARCVHLATIQCSATPVTLGYCMKRCASDADCGRPGELACDVALGACTDFQGEFVSALGTTGAHLPDGGACAGPSPPMPPDGGTGAGASPFGLNVQADDPTDLQSSEVSLALASTGSIFVAYNYFVASSYGSKIGRSDDGGKTWTVIPVADPTNTGDPALAIDPRNDALYYAYLGGTFTCAAGLSFQAGNEVHLIHSADFGKTWSAPVAVNVGARAARPDHFLDKPQAAVGPEGNVYVTFADYTVDVTAVQPSDIVLARSTDGGASWSDVQVNAPSLPPAGRDLEQPVVDALGDVFVMWAEPVVGGGISPARSGHIYVARSVDRGQTFGLPSEVDPSDPAASWIPSIAAAQDGSAVYVAYQNWNGAPEEFDVKVAMSVDGAQTFLPPVKVNDDATCATHWLPWVAVDGSGNPWVAWYDNRHGDERVMGARGTRTGSALSFGPNFQIDDRASTPFNTGRGLSNLTDYLGLAIRGHTIVAGWADLRLYGPPASWARVFVSVGTF